MKTMKHMPHEPAPGTQEDKSWGHGWLYRYESYIWVQADKDTLWSHAPRTTVNFQVFRYPIIRETNKTWWIVCDRKGTVKQVRKSWFKRWASPTVQEAWQDLEARTKKRVQHAKDQLRAAEAVIDKINQESSYLSQQVFEKYIGEDNDE